MIIVTFANYPTERAKEMGMRFVEMPPLPEFLTMTGTWVNSDVGVGIKTITMYECEQDKMKEGIVAVNKRMANYMGVEGFTYSSGPWMEAHEALGLIGMG